MPATALAITTIHALTAFADLFHHRLILLFYRAWADAQPTVSLDRGRRGAVRRLYRKPDPSVASRRSFSATRLPDMPDTSWPDIWSGRRAIRKAFRDPAHLQLGVPVEIVELLPHWMPVEPAQRTGYARREHPPAWRRRYAGHGGSRRAVEIRVAARAPCRASNTWIAARHPLRRQLTDWVRHYPVRMVVGRAAADGRRSGYRHRAWRRPAAGLRQLARHANQHAHADDLVYRLKLRVTRNIRALPARPTLSRVFKEAAMNHIIIAHTPLDPQMLDSARYAARRRCRRCMNSTWSW